MADRKKAAIFSRELPIYPGDEVLGIYSETKWAHFTGLLSRYKDEAEILYVFCPEVLGDDYLELVVNLSKVAKSGLALRIAEPSHTIKILTEIDEH